MSSDFGKIPMGWEIVTVGGIADSIQYGHTASAVDRETGPRFLRITDIQEGRVNWASVPSCNLTDEELPKYQLKPRDLVFARTGATTGKSFLIRHCPEAVFASYLIRVRISREMDERFLALFFQSPEYWRQIEGGKRGIGQPNVNGTILGQVQFLLSPLAEQRRIVEKIEELFSELDAGVANLKKARAQLTVYRQALLKHAFEGKFTAEWRAQHAAELEPAEQLLVRIRAEHKQRFAKTRQYNAPPDPEIEGLPAIPQEWAWARIDMIGVVGSGMSVSKERLLEKPVEVPYLRVANVQRGHLNLAEMKTMKVEADALDDLKLQPGDILFNEGGDRDKLGRGWVWDGKIDPCITQNHVFRVSPLSTSLVDPKFVSHWGNTFGQQFFLSHGKQTTNLASINKSVLSSLPVPVPSYAEQLQIVSQIEEQTSVIDALEADIDLNLQKAEALRQSILKKAFAGELVPQDPADEPASVLLARIRAEREAQAAAAAVAKAGKPRKIKAP